MAANGLAGLAAGGAAGEAAGLVAGDVTDAEVCAAAGRDQCQEKDAWGFMEES